MVFQQFALMPWLTVRDNVGLGLDIRGVDKATRDKTVDEKLKLVRWRSSPTNMPTSSAAACSSALASRAPSPPTPASC
jgi:ABC-type proline/glycine betaine transport system ATPase subunit